MDYTEVVNASEHQTLSKAVAGDKDALGALLELYGPQIEADLKISSTWQGAFDRVDVMQVTYLDAFVSIGKFDPSRGDSFLAWLRRIADNNLNDAIRGLEAQKNPSPRRQIKPGTGDSAVDLFDVLSATGGTPSRTVRREEAIDRLKRALECLPPHYARVVELYDLSGQSADQVAKALQRSTGAVFMLRARAHERLREILGAPWQFFETRP